jgi:hypothetical protein
MTQMLVIISLYDGVNVEHLNVNIWTLKISMVMNVI